MTTPRLVSPGRWFREKLLLLELEDQKLPPKSTSPMYLQDPGRFMYEGALLLKLLLKLEDHKPSTQGNFSPCLSISR
jgi:hypothetical protein